MADGWGGVFADEDSDAGVEDVEEAGSEEIKRVDVRFCCLDLGSPVRDVKIERHVALKETHLGPEGMVAADMVTNDCDRNPRIELYVWYLGCIITAVARCWFNVRCMHEDASVTSVAYPKQSLVPIGKSTLSLTGNPCTSPGTLSTSAVQSFVTPLLILTPLYFG